MNNETALSLFRTLNGYESQKEGLFASLLAQHLEDKQISLDTFRFMAKESIPIATLIHQGLMRSRGFINLTEMNFLVKMVYSCQPISADTESYDGSPEHNKMIDNALTLYNDNQTFIGESAMAKFDPIKNVVTNSSTDLKTIPIAIIGRGAAGIMMNAALRLAGFTNISTFDKHGSALGIWGQPNVNGGTKNNPRHLDFGGFASVGVALGDGTRDGNQVKDFVLNIGRRFDLFDGGEKTSITKIDAANNLKYIIHYEQEKQAAFAEFPIVINCMGTGKPRDFSDKKRMELYKSSKRPIAVRWQQRLERKDVEDQRIAIVGLGNSTAEMMSQLNEFRNAGVNCDYRIFTHYPEDSVMNPTDTVFHRGRNFRMFRDLSKPNLTGFQGDLSRARQDYYRALREDRIVSDVRAWGVNESKYLSAGDGSYRYDKLFVLTGYKQNQTELTEKYSIEFDGGGNPIADYDGEFRNDGEISKGYFGLGALMDSEHDPNSVVIPGMMFRIPDMIFTIICRAAEYTASKRKG